MYVVPTPLIGKATKSCIEDFFYKTTKDIPYLGKTFDQNCTKETATHYGKATFAFEVVKPNADNINFSKFKPLLNNLVAAIAEHSKNFSIAKTTP